MTTTGTTTAATTTAARAATEGTTASAPDRPRFDGRPDHGAAAARTEQLFADHGRLVAGLCRGLLRDRAEAEDAAQQTFLSAHRALLNGSSPDEPAAWLATIARNECWARIKARMRQPLPTAGVEDEQSSADPVEEAIRNADLAALWSAIGALPKPQRDALLLREFGGLSYAELAGALAVTGSAVESLLFRARHGVRARLEAAYAALTGASWVESLARLAGGIGGGMAPVAAKVAVVGVGAAVATGGYVAAPHVLRKPGAPVRPAHSSPRRSQAVPTAVLVAESAPTVASRRGDSSGDDHSGRGRGKDDGTSSTASGSERSGSGESGEGESSGEGRSASGERSGEESSGSTSSGPGNTASDDTGSDDSRSDDSHAAASSASSGDSSGKGSDHGSGDGSGGGDGSSGHGEGGLTPATTSPAVTVTVPVTDQAPPAAEPVPTTGG
jgi:RNA polymerase sigma factor (sigma-70 family)